MVDQAYNITAGDWADLMSVRIFRCGRSSGLKFGKCLWQSSVADMRDTLLLQLSTTIVEFYWLAPQMCLQLAHSENAGALSRGGRFSSVLFLLVNISVFLCVPASIRSGQCPGPVFVCRNPAACVGAGMLCP